MKPHFLTAAVLLTASLAPAQVDIESETDGFLWGALVVATDQKPSQPSRFTEAEEPLIERLGKAFRFTHFLKLGEHTQEISREYESWLVPSQELFLKIDSMGPFQNGMKLDIQLWHRQNVVVKTNCILRSGSPVFIEGPKWGDDQLVLVIELRPKVEAINTVLKSN